MGEPEGVPDDRPHCWGNLREVLRQQEARRRAAKAGPPQPILLLLPHALQVGGSDPRKISTEKIKMFYDH